MKLKLLTVAAVALTTLSQTPVYAQNMARLEQQDALFLACVAARGYTDAATVICYRAAYGSETSGGGASNTVDTRIPYNDCRGREFECSFPNTRTQ